MGDSALYPSLSVSEFTAFEPKEFASIIRTLQKSAQELSDAAATAAMRSDAEQLDQARQAGYTYIMLTHLAKLDLVRRQLTRS